jgi:hypothetical protein
MSSNGRAAALHAADGGSIPPLPTWTREDEGIGARATALLTENIFSCPQVRITESTRSRKKAVRPSSPSRPSSVVFIRCAEQKDRKILVELISHQPLSTSTGCSAGVARLPPLEGKMSEVRIPPPGPLSFEAGKG